jgi:hypothetical protein
MSLWEMGLSYKIIGQGDNQVCIVVYTFLLGLLKKRARLM